ncbi:hypothetical protein QBZ16_004884 [Prototheca wickerhamii]|uniref:Uncharacterized protein n=1 Tax=Prototheca wickerhamii TaxID=3111 RepID=A0AAD9MJY7_PROWI|nr:hypothetical protein QBZ16_004884 [Prototheca wickerhamii]
MKCRGFAATATLLLLLCSQALGARHLAAQTPLPEEIETCCEALAAIGFTSELPVFILDTLGHNVTTKGKNVDVAWCTCPMGNKAYKAQNGTAVASVHGNSSAKFAKKSFNFKTTHPDGSKDSKSLLGMPKESKWVLYGNDEADLTRGMRDFVTYNLARASGEYATRTVWTEVFVVSDGAALSMDDYYGLYILEEKVDRDADRVDIPKWTPEDPSGGYIFAFVHGDYNSGEPTTKVIERFDFPFVIKYPTPSDAANASLSETWLTNYLSSFQAAVMADDYLTATSPSYLDFMELDTFIDFFLLTELTKSPDGYRDSIYMHKGLGQRFSMGPAWDYNEAYGECCGFPIEGYEQNGKSAPGIAGGSAISPNGWRFLICEDRRALPRRARRRRQLLVPAALERHALLRARG